MAAPAPEAIKTVAAEGVALQGVAIRECLDPVAAGGRPGPARVTSTATVSGLVRTGS
jgi:hypothetical protein